MSGTILRLWRVLVLLAPLFLGSSASAYPAWWDSHKSISDVFDPAAMTSLLSPSLSYFSNAFMAVGFTVVVVASVRRVSQARSGDESMGWVAGMVMTVSLMAAGPSLGQQLFAGCDELASRSGYKNADTILRTWDALKVIMPGTSPTTEVLGTSGQAPEPSEGTSKQDAAWTKRAWEWMQRAWGAMSNATSSFVASLRAAFNNTIIFLILLLPALALIFGMLAMAFGTFMREVLHQLMDVFLPLMIAMAAFGPTRGAAHNFLMKYVTLAMWPVAWAMGNAVAIGLLTSTMNWVVSTCHEVLGITSNSPAAVMQPVLEVGVLHTAAPLMSWALLLVISFTILFSATLILVSAFGAPAALGATLTKGASFGEAQLGAVFRAWAGGAAHVVTSSSTAGGGITPAVGQGSSTGGSTSASLQSVAGRLGTSTAAGGPVGIVAAAGAYVVTRVAKAMGAIGAEPSESAETERSATAGVGAPSIKDSMGVESRPSRRPSPRKYRRTK